MVKRSQRQCGIDSQISLASPHILITVARVAPWPFTRCKVKVLSFRRILMLVCAAPIELRSKPSCLPVLPVSGPGLGSQPSEPAHMAPARRSASDWAPAPLISVSFECLLDLLQCRILTVHSVHPGKRWLFDSLWP